ncbi:MAG TPA: amidohydrolase family protein [Bryobacteraceae bacterium]
MDVVQLMERMQPQSGEPSRRSVIVTALGTLAPWRSPAATGSSAEIIDYHQYVYSPEAAVRTSAGGKRWKGVDAKTLLANLDAVGIQRAVVLSVAYDFANPYKPAVPNEYEHVKGENDWTGAQIAQYPKRFVGFCSVNPLRPYALAEISRCAKNPNLRTGLHLHFGNSDVNLDNSEDLARVRRVFGAADRHGMAVLVHLHANVNHHRPYGAKEARIVLEQVIPEAPDVDIQIAHLAGAGGYDDPTTDEALQVFVQAIERKDSRMKHIYFDVSGIALPGMWEDKAGLIVKRIRQVGISRVLYGSDVAIPGNTPKEALERWHKLPLTQKEFRMIDSNVASYIRDWLKSVRRN